MPLTDTRPNGHPRSLFSHVASDVNNLRLVQGYLRSLADRTVPEANAVEAWRRFYAAYNPLIHGLVHKRPVQDADEQDQCQDIWRVLMTRLQQYDPEQGKFPCWLQTLAQHVLVDVGRSHARS